MADTVGKTIRCDIFCSVVDNYGDIGVCWRLARQLSNEYSMVVRLWVDDLRSFGKLCPEVDSTRDEQRCRGVEILKWVPETFIPHPQPRKNSLSHWERAGGEGRARGGADLVIEAFACKLPETYMQAMAAREPKPVWLNLEYLSAEDWVEGCHKLPSPHPSLPLTKHFFFPGFTEKTGGLLLERDLLARRDAFQSDAGALQRYWQGLGVSKRAAGELRVSLFGYENEAMEALLGAWESGDLPVTCLVPEGRSLPQVAGFFSQKTGKAGEVWQRGNLRVHALPFVEQERYDELLWACDVNFVRGEDSCVRAQWAGRPFIWQIYPQHDGVHLEKLEALRARYAAGLPPEAAQAVRDLWLAWNGGPDISGAWGRFAAHFGVLGLHGPKWANRLASNNLARNLLDFYRELAASDLQKIIAGKW
ncbi:MAG: elongation factor P maturation arginine rhamnosyltransferase EarP [Aquabacterium sp.]|uniref:elongation factor P maturation arginine rhamnosyltransferase EarP n=1 Tax=Aquabacterium sp. TaxID=1872578 RepID=UPI002724B828|nr:elongation factor P maturation arginine rhamnosyltransferase EarP [Aquabacterium sp.]MDO9005020.1 elongation factor P maturation arginine rhamnosyltransferase EarP [Aquabacterium sp.]